MEEETGIYREEVFAIMGALADISVDTRRIIALLGDEEDVDDEEEEDA